MNQKDLRQFADAILSPAGSQGVSSYIPEVQSFLEPQARQQFLSSAGAGAEKAAGVIGDVNEQNRRASVQNRVDQISDMFDPNKYVKKRKEDGGFDFYDPTGKQIDIATFAKFTGKRRADILSDSENPLDLKYLRDYQDTLDVIDAINSGDTARIQEYAAAQPALRGMTPDDLLKRLMQQYPHMYGLGTYDDTRGINSTGTGRRGAGYVPYANDVNAGASGGFQL